jgi:hypothetical protein
MKALILLSILALPAHAVDIEVLEADAHYQNQAYYSEQAYTACYEHLAGIDPSLARVLEYCMTDDECEQATQLCEGFSHE